MKKFECVATTKENANWEKLISREHELYSRSDEVRSPFSRDYTRILHSMAYRRLKHKTQVFYNIDNDHICTRMEHVSHVDSVSSTIASALGLNSELTKAISIGHDLGHAPFGHQGEVIIRELTEKYLGKNFWHEQNGVRFVDIIELIPDNQNIYKNLDLTFAVRDGIISHCGEVDENGLFPRDISIGIEDFDAPGKFQATTWEGCVVKMSDKIAYVGRDIEDAITLGILSEADQKELQKMAQIKDESAINTTVIMHNMIIDICENSSPEAGIKLSAEFNEQLNRIKEFNYNHIYKSERLQPYVNFSTLVINQIFDVLHSLYDGAHTFERLSAYHPFAPSLISTFESWLINYMDIGAIPAELHGQLPALANEKIYGALDNETVYLQAVIDFLAGMTDRFAVKSFNELLQFGFQA